MKGDFSRRTFNSQKHYNAVLKQQGRVDVDADWNEQTEIRKYIDRTSARDIIGPCGAPEDNAGFEIRVKDGKELYIGEGRYYVDGILCENDAETPYRKQPDMPDPPDIPVLLKEGETDTGLVYLDVWDRHITAIDDPLIREKALGGPDTATRVKTVWQVRVLPVKIQEGDPEKIEELEEDRQDLLEKIKELVVAGASEEEIEQYKQRLMEVEKEIARLSARKNCQSVFPQWDDLITSDPDTGKMKAGTVESQAAEGPCIIRPSAGYKGLENQLYRVEIHQGGPFGTATFKWSRDNGAVVTSIIKISGKVVTVQDVGLDSVLGFANGQWVEVLDDALELNGMPGQLLQIEKIDSATMEITLSSAPAKLANTADGVDKTRHPKLRRWDQDGDDATEAGLQMVPGWIELKEGIRVQFSDEQYKTGNYWLIPARTATGEIEWPPYKVPNENPIEQPPLGIHHHFCRLALVQMGSEAGQPVLRVIEDCRSIFPPLTGMTSIDESGLRIEDVLYQIQEKYMPLRIDDTVFVSDFVNGIHFVCNAPIDPAAVDGRQVGKVTLELPYPLNKADHEIWPGYEGEGFVGFAPIIIAGSFSVKEDPNEKRKNHAIFWLPDSLSRSWLTHSLFKRFRVIEMPQERLLIRIELNGNLIWGAENSHQFLDADLFAEAVTDNTEPIMLLYTSSNGRPGGTLRMRFYITEQGE